MAENILAIGKMGNNMVSENITYKMDSLQMVSGNKGVALNGLMM